MDKFDKILLTTVAIAGFVTVVATAHALWIFNANHLVAAYFGL